MVECTFIEITVIYPKVRTDIELINRFNVYKSIPEHTPIVITIIFIVVY